MSGKGSKRRPALVARNEFDSSFDRIFRFDPTCANCKNWDGNTYHQYGDCQLPGPVKITKHRSEKCGEWEKK